MRLSILLILVLAAALAGAWLGGETLLARQAGRMIAADPRVQAAAITPLREADRIGLHLEQVALETPQGSVSLPEAEFWAAPTSPTTFHLALPPDMTVPVGGRERQLAAENARLMLRLSPANGMGPTRAAVTSGAATLDGQPLLGGLDVAAQLVPLGAGAPQQARASYRVSVRVQDLTPGALAGLPPALALSAQGDLRLYLTGALTRATLRGGTPPQLAGIGAEGLTLRLGDLSLRVMGLVEPDAQGRMQGALFVHTADPAALARTVADLGLIPEGAAVLTGTAMTAAANAPLPEGIVPPADPAPGESRIPLFFRDGRAFLGPLPLGAAPAFPQG